MTADLVVKDLTVEFASAGYIVRALDSVNLRASSGDLVLLLGPSGCGKTTLLSCLAGILQPTRGSVTFGGAEVTALRADELTEYRRHTVGVVFQALNLIPSLSAFENVLAPLLADRCSPRAARARAEDLVRLVGLEDRAHHRPSDLSGGQQQRVAIARALVHEPQLLLADEPTAHLDYIQVESVLRILRELAQPGRLVVAATHDQRIVPLADRVIDLAPKLETTVTGPRRTVLRRGEVLFEQGSRGELVYVVDEGEIALTRVQRGGLEEIVDIVPTGGYFGELAPLLGFPRAATARARTDAVVTGYTVRDFRDLVGAAGVADMLAGRAKPASRKRPAGRRRAARSGRTRARTQRKA